MTHVLPPLPYAKNALLPYISEETLNYHYGKHHQAYVNNLNKLIQGTDKEKLSLEAIIKQSSGGIFNNAAQVWNHTFYWHCLSSRGGDEPRHEELSQAIARFFGSFAQFKEQFTQTALTTFGSGWAWLVKDAQGDLSIVSTSNAGTPIVDGKIPLLTCDVWEHAYYVDYRNDKSKYLEQFWHLVNWDFVSQKLTERAT